MTFSTDREGYVSDMPATSCADVLSASPYVATVFHVYVESNCCFCFHVMHIKYDCMVFFSVLIFVYHFQFCDTVLVCV